ncbi:toprim domain-containing protein [Phytobacter diazotrophicus]|uniref:DNA primase n=1 Tax=Phytobacter diazotrophicus TaxID=395631 RepID=A0ABM7VYB8_9ENTR|nr:MULTISPECIES: toprim domain-containing protein [Phytobacter]MDU4154368.1 toprim domain-containing protein [Enterobacteriaceae bacterium]PTA90386.1 DNA primase [Kluyvera sp. Nf5]QIH64306.1 DNA primase [Enterobacteriaceae bacterium A-F18]MDU4994967.1 toprim domain-containing protein [Enterobacteriaceae bacterium]MDU7134520.1 toprim domain-containing protein [Enterobacteriaceae bacterium]
MKTSEAAKGRWSEIFEYYGLPPVTGKNHFKGECPVCGARGKYRVDDRDGSGSWICVCGSGDGMSLLVKTQGKSFSAISTEVDQIIGNDYRHEKIPVHSSAARLRQRTISKFAKLAPLRGTAGAGYLQHRGITRLPADAIRFCDKQRHAGKVYQALYALATDDKGELCYLHRTLLEGEHKAPLGESAKRQKSMQEENYLEYARSVAIRMFPVSSTLGIAEGIETALSCYQIYGVNTWAVMNSNFMKKFRAPAGVKHLVVFADMDRHSATGQAAAFECAHANLLAKNDLLKVSVRWPDNGDFNDMLQNGDQVRELVFTKKQQVAA